MRKLFPEKLEQTILNLTESRMQTVQMLFDRAKIEFDERLPINADYACGTTEDIARMVLYSLFNLSDAEKKEFCDSLFFLNKIKRED